MAKEGADKVFVKVMRSGIHQRGLFAIRDIKNGVRMIEYTGDRVPKVEAQRRAIEQWNSATGNGDGAVYIFTLNDRYDIDGTHHGNIARFANHSCDPNSETEVVDGRIWIVATRKIKKGEEIVYNYNFDLESYEDHPCLCGAARCVGYIVGEEYWPKLRKSLKKNKTRNRRHKKKNKKDRKKGKKEAG